MKNSYMYLYFASFIKTHLKTKTKYTKRIKYRTYFFIIRRKKNNLSVKFKLDQRNIMHFFFIYESIKR